jgi:hypothetical protein
MSMKYLFLTIIAIAITAICGAQSILIGGTTLNTRAIMEVRSTTKGVLIPRMTTTQRLAIPSPVAGLMVYDISRQALYGYDGTAWRYFLTDDMWKQTGNNVYNSGDSIGIRISSPEEKLHVNGDLQTNGQIELTANSGTSAKLLSEYNGANVDGYVHGFKFYDNSFLRGFINYRKYNDLEENRIDFGFTSTLFSIQNNGVSYLDAPGASIQFQQAFADKGFLQLSGNDFRIGTNSSNSNGRFVLRSGGADRFFVDSDGKVGIGGAAAKSSNVLEVAGGIKGSNNLSAPLINPVNVEVGSEVLKPLESGFANLLPAFYGTVAINGTCTCSSPAISITNPFNGNYLLTYPNMNSNDIIIVKAGYWAERANATYGGLGDPGFFVSTGNNSYGGKSLYNSDWSFIIYRQ